MISFEPSSNVCRRAFSVAERQAGKIHLGGESLSVLEKKAEEKGLTAESIQTTPPTALPTRIETGSVK